MLTSRQPIWIGWGKELITLYNDPYKDPYDFPFALYQLFYNLINNSLKFNSYRAEITISSSTIKRDDKEFAEIIVSDNGIGVDQQFAETLFKCFLKVAFDRPIRGYRSRVGALQADCGASSWHHFGIG